MADTSASLPPTPLIPTATLSSGSKAAGALRQAGPIEGTCAGSKSECIVTPDQGAATFFGPGGPSFNDILDLINPLQHLPIVSSIYRSLTGDKIGDGPRVIGGLLWGGPIGLFSATADLAIEKDSGRDMIGTLAAAVTGEPIGRQGTPAAGDTGTRALAMGTGAPPSLAQAATSSSAQLAQAGVPAPWVDESRLAAAIEQARLNQTDLDAAMIDARNFGPPVWTARPEARPAAAAVPGKQTQVAVPTGAAPGAQSGVVPDASALPPGAIARRAPAPTGSHFVSAPFHFDSRLNGSSPSARRAASPYATPSAGAAQPAPPAAGGRASGSLLAPETARALLAAPTAAPAGGAAPGTGVAPTTAPAAAGPPPAFLDAMRAGLDRYGRSARPARGPTPATE